MIDMNDRKDSSSTNLEEPLRRALADTIFLSQPHQTLSPHSTYEIGGHEAELSAENKHPFAGSSALLSVIPSSDGIDIDEEAALYNEFPITPLVRVTLPRNEKY